MKISSFPGLENTSGQCNKHTWPKYFAVLCLTSFWGLRDRETKGLRLGIKAYQEWWVQVPPASSHPVIWICTRKCRKIRNKSRFTRTDVLVKSVESVVPTALAYDVARSSIGCQLRCRPRHLTAGLNYEVILAALKLLTEARNRQPETFKPNL